MIGSATVRLFEILNAAPEETVVAPAVVPSPFALVIARVPDDIVVAPV